MSGLATRVTAARNFVLKVSRAMEWLPLLLARLTLGWIFVESGWGKLHNLPKVIEFFASLGIPAPGIQAPFAAATELVCGLLLLAGLLTRIAAVPLAVTMAVAILAAKRSEIAALSDLFALAEFLYIILLGLLAAFGAGPLSLDHLLSWFTESNGKEPETAESLLSARS